jgi:hypothetical protein
VNIAVLISTVILLGAAVSKFIGIYQDRKRGQQEAGQIIPATREQRKPTSEEITFHDSPTPVKLVLTPTLYAPFEALQQAQRIESPPIHP